MAEDKTATKTISLRASAETIDGLKAALDTVQAQHDDVETVGDALAWVVPEIAAAIDAEPIGLDAPMRDVRRGIDTVRKAMAMVCDRYEAGIAEAEDAQRSKVDALTAALAQSQAEAKALGGDLAAALEDLAAARDEAAALAERVAGLEDARARDAEAAEAALAEAAEAHAAELAAAEEARDAEVSALKEDLDRARDYAAAIAAVADRLDRFGEGLDRVDEAVAGLAAAEVAEAEDQPAS